MRLKRRYGFDQGSLLELRSGIFQVRRPLASSGHVPAVEGLSKRALPINSRHLSNGELPRRSLATARRAGREADYADSGFDKGHMAPANYFMRSVAAIKATFVLTNAVPQKHGVNGGKWAQLEKAVHDLAATEGTVWIFSGPVFVGSEGA
jgi:hypothetical protein